MDLLARKATIRRSVLARRARLTPAERAAAARAIGERLAALPEVSAAGVVLGFASFGTEVPTEEIMETVLRAGKRLLLPYVDGEFLRAAEVRSVAELAPGYRGIREPAERAPVGASAAEAIVVPGVAFDPAGHRLGYGGGFYDAFLAGCPRRIPRVGIAFDLQVVDEVPVAARDETVDIVVTETREIRCARPGG